jgi:DNA (cytosine-5)-methyltransferase 1
MVAMNGLAICSGIGGIDLGLSLVVPDYRTVCHVEREAYAAAVLVSRMADASLAEAPVWDDLATFDGKPWRGLVDIVTAGLPCQPYSVAGKRKGHDDERAIWPEFIRVVEEVQPALVFIENVPGFLAYFRPVGEELSRLGYEYQAGLFSAAECGAPHRRERLFVLAERKSIGLEGCKTFIQSWRPTVTGGSEGMAHAGSQRAENEQAGTWTPAFDPSARSGSGVAHAKSRNREDGAGPSEQLGRVDGGSGQMADAEGWCRDGYLRHNGGQALRETGGTGETVADAFSGRHDGRASEPERGEVGRVAAEGTGEAVGDAAEPRRSGGAGECGTNRAIREQARRAGSGGSECGMGDPGGEGLEVGGRIAQPGAFSAAWPPGPAGDWSGIHEHFWPTCAQSGVRRVAHGLAPRLDRLRACGNGVVPAVAALAFESLMERSVGVAAAFCAWRWGG